MWIAFIMTVWTIRTETDDLESVREMVEDQRNRGYNAWIEDENGQRVDEEPFKKSGRSLYQKVLGIVIKQITLPTGAAAINHRDVPHGGLKMVSDTPFKYLAVHIVDNGAPLYDAPPK
jgi:hypothetical protein